MLLLSLGLFVTDALVTSHGALTLAGAVTFVIGALMLFDPAGPAYQVSLWTALAIAGTLVLLLGVALSRIVKARRNPVEVGVGLLVGEEAEVRRDGLVAVNGELWRARRDGRPPAAAGRARHGRGSRSRPRPGRRIREPHRRELAPWTSH